MGQSTNPLVDTVEKTRGQLPPIVEGWEDFGRRLDEHLVVLPRDMGNEEETTNLLELFATQPAALLLLQAMATDSGDSAMRKGKTPGFVAPGTSWATVPIYYATDRLATSPAEPNEFFGSQYRFRQYYNAHRVHTSLDGETPSEITGETTSGRADLNQFQWKSHCRGLYQLPVAA